MLPLLERLQGVVDILIASNSELQSPKADETGYVFVPPQLLMQTMLKLLDTTDTSKVSLDLGCGNGGWMLLAACAGFSSYGIELNTFLLDHAQQNYERCVAAEFIDPLTPCAWIIGDMIPERYNNEYMAFRKLHHDQERSMPVAAVVENAYSRLPVRVATADIIYCWSWPTQSQFIFSMLNSEAKQDTIFILPSYERYTKNNNSLLLTPISIIQRVFMGRRK